MWEKQMGVFRTGGRGLGLCGTQRVQDNLLRTQLTIASFGSATPSASNDSGSIRGR